MTRLWARRGTRTLSLEVEVETAGWSEPARTSGPPEDSWPAEGEETSREILSARLEGGKALPEGVLAALEPHLLEALREDALEDLDDL